MRAWSCSRHNQITVWSTGSNLSTFLSFWLADDCLMWSAYSRPDTRKEQGTLPLSFCQTVPRKSSDGDKDFHQGRNHFVLNLTFIQKIIFTQALFQRADVTSVETRVNDWQLNISPRLCFQRSTNKTDFSGIRARKQQQKILYNQSHWNFEPRG